MLLRSPSMVYPQGFHITFGTYMARPPGSSKPHVDCDNNEYGTPLPPKDADLEQWARENAKYEVLKLTLEQRRLVEAAILEVAKRYKWTIHAIAVQSDHVHVIVTMPRDPLELREAIKAAGSRILNATYGERLWWAIGGSCKWLWKRDYFQNAVKYVSDQRDPAM